MPGPLDFIDGAVAPDLATPAIEAPEAIAAPPTPEPAPEGPVRGPDGKFAARTPAEPLPEPVQAAQPEPAPVAPQTPEPPQHAPITALLDERDKRQKAERERDELQARLRQAQPREPQAIPDPYDDPEGFAQFQAAAMDHRIYQANLVWSRRMAEVQHTPETVNEAHEWGVKRCDEDPFFNQKVQTSPDPYGFVLAEWKREQLLAEVGPDDLTAFRAWKASQSGAQPVAGQPAPPSPPVARPPVSLVNAPSAGGAAHVPQGPGQAYDALLI